MATQRFDVTGMTCAACSARVEQVTSTVPGVEKAVVNLLKNSMDVTYDGTPETIEAISAAVDKAGYGAIPHSEGTTGASAAQVQPIRPVNAAAQEAKTVRMRLIVSFIFAVPLFYLDMGHMWGWPLLHCFLGAENSMTLGLTQLLLVIPIVFVNFKFFRNGFKGLVHRSPNMDTLVALGATASMIYSIAQLYHVGIALGAGELHEAHTAAMDLYFEGAGMILTLITLGKYFEARSKGRTTDAITALMDLAPKTATLVNEHGRPELWLRILVFASMRHGSNCIALENPVVGGCSQQPGLQSYMKIPIMPCENTPREYMRQENEQSRMPVQT